MKYLCVNDWFFERAGVIVDLNDSEYKALLEITEIHSGDTKNDFIPVDGLTDKELFKLALQHGVTITR